MVVICQILSYTEEPPYALICVYLLRSLIVYIFLEKDMVYYLANVYNKSILRFSVNPFIYFLLKKRSRSTCILDLNTLGSKVLYEQ